MGPWGLWIMRGDVDEGNTVVGVSRVLGERETMTKGDGVSIV